MPRPSWLDEIAQCRIQHAGKIYNYGDRIPPAVKKAHPNAVRDKPLTPKDIEKLSAEQLRELLVYKKEIDSNRLTPRLQMKGD